MQTRYTNAGGEVRLVRDIHKNLVPLVISPYWNLELRSSASQNVNEI